MRSLNLLPALLAFALTTAFAGPVEYVQPVRPYARSTPFTTPYAPVTPGQKIIPLLTWAPDGHIVITNGGLAAKPGSPMARALGEPVQLAVMDRIDDQVKAVIGGQPFFRGTVAQVALANEGLTKINPNLELVVIYQLSWSTGSDGFVARNAATLQDLKGKSIVGQLNGPHMLDMVPRILEDAGLQPTDVTYKYVHDITSPTGEEGSNPASALRNDPTLAGAALVGPDISVVTSGEGSGSVRGTKVLFTTKTANRMIADVVAVRRDYFENNQPKLKALVKVWLEEANAFAADLENVAKKKSANAVQLNAFKKKVEPLAALFLGDKSMVNDYLLWVGLDAELAKVKGNVEFFQSSNNPVGFDRTVDGARRYLTKSGFLEQAVAVRHAGWDWSDLGASAFATKSTNTFAGAEAARNAANKASANTLFKHAFAFPPKEAELDWRNHEAIFDTIHGNVKRYGGAIVQIRGHADPLLYNFFKMKLAKGDTTYSRGTQTGLTIPPLESVMAANTKLSYTRAASIRTAYAAYLREKIGVSIDESDLSRFDIRGMGISDPVYPNPVTKEQTAANMRGELVIISVETELPSEFSAEDLK